MSELRPRLAGAIALVVAGFGISFAFKTLEERRRAGRSIWDTIKLKACRSSGR